MTQKRCDGQPFAFFPPVPGQLTRILSDVHFGDRASRVDALSQLRPLVSDVDAVIFNGDTLDTRPGPAPRHTAECRRQVGAFIAGAAVPVTLLTGNHDPDLSDQHCLDLAGGQVFVVHGDVLFDDIVPWGRDGAMIRRKIAAATNDAPPHILNRMPLAGRLSLWREVAGSIPQRHQSERNLFKYAWRFAIDTVWPPTRFLRIIGAWKREPILATALARQHRPQAKFVLLGHTHRPAIRGSNGGPLIINTGSFTAPFGGYAVDLGSRSLVVRRIEHHRREFRAGAVVAEFPLT